MDYSNTVAILLFVFGILFSIIGFLCVYILNSIKQDLKTLYRKVDNHDNRLTKLETEHAVCFNEK